MSEGPSPGLTPFGDALAAVLAGAAPGGPQEEADLAGALNRVLARDLAARLTHPPADVSAMDGYALRAAEALPGARLALVGASEAGRPLGRPLGPREAARVLTGGHLPAGADAVLIQENARVEEGDGGARAVLALEPVAPGRFVRPAGLDFRAGAPLLVAGRRLSPRDLSLAAAGGHARLSVARRPLVAILATGDELVPPGEEPGPAGIVASTTPGVAAVVAGAGGRALDLGIAGDDLGALVAALRRGLDAGADVLVTLGGASVGDRDLVRPALAALGAPPALWRVAMRPGKPFLFARAGAARVLGFPGNPVSSLVCALLFLDPLVRALGGETRAGAARDEPARLGADLPANDERRDHLRAMLVDGPDGAIATPLPRQDSAMLAALAHADALLVREPHAPAARIGDACRVIRL